jgi:Flp pilus assembly protein TadG
MLRTQPRSVDAAASKRRSLLRDTCGAAAVELALTLPVFLALAIGTLKFGVAMTQYLTLNNAAAQGAMAFALSRGTTTPYTTTTTAITSAAPNLASGSVTKTLKVSGAACTTDTACQTALVAGATAAVTVTYPCDIKVLGIDFYVQRTGGPTTCTLSATSAQMVQ